MLSEREPLSLPSGGDERFFSIWSWWPLVVMVTAAGVTFVLWSLPSWEMLSAAGSLSMLWQIEANRPVLVVLFVKLCAPLWVSILLAACFWLVSLLSPVWEESSPEPESVEELFVSPVEPSDQETEKGEGFPVSAHEEMQSVASAHALPLLAQFTPEIAVDETLEEEETASFLPSPISEQTDALPPFLITITLLKNVRIMLQVPSRGIRCEIPIALKAKRVQLLAYVACLRGQRVQRERMIEQVFGHGLDDEQATPKRISEAFHSHKKLLRYDLRKAILHLNAEAGCQLVPPDLDMLAHDRFVYWLADGIHVEDLEEIEAQHQVIEQAREDGLLVDQVPESVKQACDALIEAYTGDFLQELVIESLDEFDPWVSSWARKPYTVFRDYYFQALWYAAEYEFSRGRQITGSSDEDTRKEQRKHWGQAAQYFRMYAMKCDSRFDTKVTFGREKGERVIMSERALRRSLVLYGAIGATHQVDQVYSAYYKQMRALSGKIWEPSLETRTDLASAKEQTSAYRFPKQAFLPDPLPQGEDNLEVVPS